MYKKDIYIPEFSKTVKPEEISYLSFYPQLSHIEEIETLIKKLLENFGKKHVPLYRMGDGEFMFLLGRIRPLHKMNNFEKLRFYIKSIFIRCGFLNHSAWHGENYSYREMKKLRTKYIGDLKIISKKGFLSPLLMYSKGKFSQQFIEPLLNLFENEHIIFNSQNYFPCLSIYVLFSLRKYRNLLLQNKVILIITAFNEYKTKRKIHEELIANKVNDVFFYEITSNRAMFEIIDKDKLPNIKVDLVLIGAGMGSANIINQLEHLEALCLDVGNVIDCLANPDIRKDRFFQYPDEMYNEE